MKNFFHFYCRTKEGVSKCNFLPALERRGRGYWIKVCLANPYKDCRFRKHFQARHHDEADYKNSDAQQQNSNGQNFPNQHQNPAAEHQNKQ